MATNLVSPYVLAITATNVSSGHVVKVYNRTRGKALTATFDSSRNAVVDLAEFATALADNEVLEISVTGKFEGFTTHTVSLTGSRSGGADISITTTATSSSLTSIGL